MEITQKLRAQAGILFRRIAYFTAGYWLHRNVSRVMVEYRPDSHFNFGAVSDYDQLLESWIAGNRDMNLGDMTRFYALYLNVNQVLSEGVPGDFVELGVYKGNSAAVMASLSRKRKRHLYLFDTFSGFDARDLKGIESGRPKQFADTSLAAVQALVGTDGVTYVPGFFPESMKGLAGLESIAVAHIDCDLYAPMRAGLEQFYPRLSPGGILLLHDYSSGYWPGAKQAVDEFFRTLPEKPVLIPDKSGTAIIRKSTSGGL